MIQHKICLFRASPFLQLSFHFLIEHFLARLFFTHLFLVALATSVLIQPRERRPICTLDIIKSHIHPKLDLNLAIVFFVEFELHQIAAGILDHVQFTLILLAISGCQETDRHSFDHNLLWSERDTFKQQQFATQTWLGNVRIHFVRTRIASYFHFESKLTDICAQTLHRHQFITLGPTFQIQVLPTFDVFLGCWYRNFVWLQPVAIHIHRNVANFSG
mmetsp:Transcript_58206/g.96498  ORF Transcript_58206/g.96498 Transcript_58206/m.96498 type:complete len:217 (-) Transcript_58206:399-1049(-)